MRIVLVAAIGRDGTIGKGGGIPWRHSEDQRFFRRATMGTALVMGRRTYDSIGKPLAGRDSIVVTRDPAGFASKHPGVFAVGSIDDALALAKSRGQSTASVIGGAEIYRLALPVATEMILTEIPYEGGGDTFFPEWVREEWEEVLREPLGDAVAVTYVRKEPPSAGRA